MTVTIPVAATVPHAPQLLSVPESEDTAQVDRVKAMYRDIGDLIAEADVDVLVVLCNDHGDNFATTVVPPFYVHCGTRFEDGNRLTDFAWPLMGDRALDIVAELYEADCDPAFGSDVSLGTYVSIPIAFLELAREIPVLPILINSYIPPQPTLQRCATFGRALKGVLGRMGLRAAVIASGGLSHYPGTARYAKPGPDLDFDRTFFEGVRQHGPRYATWLDGGAAEQTGNLELRSWAMLAGLFGDGTERLAALEENWHHTYAVACWTKEEVTLDALADRDLYPPIRAENAALNRALFVLRNNYDARKLYQADAAGFVAQYGFSAEAAAALAAMDSDALRDEHGGHPLLTSGAVRALQGMTY
jgi:2,3-dihydroxyphenylpropionate 1,2-dioxygenase